MPRPEVIDISPDLIPEDSDAVSAARVRLGDGALALIELFRGNSRMAYDFRGLPKHLGDEDEMTVCLDEPFGGETYGISALERNNEARLHYVLFEFAIGARQTLWPGAYATYSDESKDPTSRFYRPYGHAR